MIRYSITLNDLKKKIREHTRTRRKKWFTEAKELLLGLPAVPVEGNFKRIWGDVKQVYITLQHTKCAFCEQRLEGSITQDVEHFRPKTAVTNWTPSAALAAAGITISQPASPAKEKGYRLLAYHPLNYAMSCKNCNSVFKRNLFPIRGARKVNATSPKDAAKEQNYLVYPISDIDDNPETLFEFEGIQPVPIAAGFGRTRALVCIELFELDDQDERKELIQDRAEAIQLLYYNLRDLADGTTVAVQKAATLNRTRMLSDSQPHANCLRSFARLFHANRAAADKVYEDLSVLLNTMSKI